VSAVGRLQYSGSYPNASRYIRVKSVGLKTPNYLNNAGLPASQQYQDFIPVAQSGSFGSAQGNLVTANMKMYQNIDNTNSQGVTGSDYNTALSLMSNSDEYKFNVITTPGLILENSTQTSTLTDMISISENRGDVISVIDLKNYGSTIVGTTSTAGAVNSSYAAAYWPWLQTTDPNTGQLVWVPASTMIPGVYAYNDRVSEAWFAPAGINRGGLGTVRQAERKLSQSDRDTLYSSKVNPIATFPGRGVVVFGQKTLQTQASALDRVNVRRLLIALKSYISQVADNLVFEQNTVATRNQFLSQVNPYLDSVQQRQGLYAFRVVMDDTNNTADVIDRNQLIGAIYLQPTKTAEFIYLNFNILPTGATFPG
jgi:phage tail sheath protein FI